MWSHTVTQPQSVGLLWTRDRLVGETSIWQQTTLKRDKHPCPRGIRNRDPRRRPAADPCLRPLGHWDRLFMYHTQKCSTLAFLEYRLFTALQYLINGINVGHVLTLFRRNLCDTLLTK
jgi:hypothetical protein